jgi:hypothetical protein
MVADGLTKPLPPITVARSLLALGLLPLQHLEIKALMCAIIPRSNNDVIVEETMSLAEVMTKRNVIVEGTMSLRRRIIKHEVIAEAAHDVIAEVEGYLYCVHLLNLSLSSYHFDFDLDLDPIPTSLTMPSKEALAQIQRAEDI